MVMGAECVVSSGGGGAALAGQSRALGMNQGKGVRVSKVFVLRVFPG